MLKNNGFASLAVIGIIVLVVAIGGSFGLFYFNHPKEKSEDQIMETPSVLPNTTPGIQGITIATKALIEDDFATNTLKQDEGKEFFIKSLELTDGSEELYAYLLDKNNSKEKFIRKENCCSSSVYSGSDSMLASPNSQKLIYLNKNGTGLVVQDVLSNKVSLAKNLSVLDPEKHDARVNIHAWSPNSDRILFNIYFSNPCGGAEYNCAENGTPENISLGYYLTDFSLGKSYYLNIASSSLDKIGVPWDELYFDDWLDEDHLLFRNDHNNILYEYNIPSSRLFLSKRFGKQGESHGQSFQFIGSYNNLYAWIDSDTHPDSSQIKINNGSETKIIAKESWAGFCSVSLSSDGQYIFYSRRINGDPSNCGKYSYNINTNETTDVKK